MSEQECDDFRQMQIAYEALQAIPFHSRRRACALWWVCERVSTEIKHEGDAVMINAAASLAAIADASEKSKPTNGKDKHGL